MVNINLKTKNTQKVTHEANSNSNTSLIVLFLMTMLVIGVMCGFYFWKKTLVKKISSIDNQISLETEKLSGEKTKKIMDLQNRLAVAKEVVDKDHVLLAVFGEIEKAIIPEVYFNSIDYNDNEISARIVAGDFTFLAKQIASFKKVEFFKEVTIGNVSVNDDGKVETDLTLTID